MDLLVKNKTYKNDIKKVFNMLTVTGEYRIIGSASFKKIKYSSDYDLEELITNNNFKKLNILDAIYNIFKKKYIECKEDDDFFITDFKCGLNSDGEPLRWSYEDMMKGYKILYNKRKMTFQECILIKTMMKMDLIVLINGVYTEFSENYYIRVDNYSNFVEHEQEPEHIKTSILKSLDEYLNVQQNYWKSLKRLFSLLIKEGMKHSKIINDMIQFFNSDVGLINKCRNELEILLIVITNNFKKPKIEDIHYNLNLINKWATDAGVNINKCISKMLKINNLDALYKDIEKLAIQLYDKVNKLSFIFLKKKSILNLII